MINIKTGLGTVAVVAASAAFHEELLAGIDVVGIPHPPVATSRQSMP